MTVGDPFFENHVFTATSTKDVKARRRIVYKSMLFCYTKKREHQSMFSFFGSSTPAAPPEAPQKPKPSTSERIASLSEWKSEGKVVKKLEESWETESCVILSRAYRQVNHCIITQTPRNDPLYSVVLPSIDQRRVGLFNRFLTTVQSRDGQLVAVTTDETGETKDCARGIYSTLYQN